MKSDEIMLKVENVSKVYKLGEIGGTTLRESMQRLKAKIRHKEDPTRKIGTKNYNKGEKFKALDNISFEVKKGERIGIIGHNGAGKSTLLKLISRVTGPTEGKIYLNGRVASMLEVGTGFHPELTGRENIYMNGAILGMTKKEIDAKMEDIIEFSEVRQFIDTPVKRYSSGMYVKLAFSVAAHLDSEIMIMDEVLAVGDMAFQSKCIQKMKTVSDEEERTVLYVSHNMRTIRELCNRVIVLNKGKIEFDGDVEKGISLYLKVFLKKKKDWDLSLFDRSNINVLNVFRFLSLSIINERCNIICGEKLGLFLSFTSNENIKKAYVLITVLKSDYSPIFTQVVEINNICADEPQFKTIFLNTDFLASGSYSLKIEAFESIGFNSIKRHDYVFDVGAFDVINKANNFDFEWKSRYWGEIFFK